MFVVPFKRGSVDQLGESSDVVLAVADQFDRPACCIIEYGYLTILAPYDSNGGRQVFVLDCPMAHYRNPNYIDKSAFVKVGVSKLVTVHVKNCNSSATIPNQ
jgi:hypothetical protein